MADTAERLTSYSNLVALWRQTGPTSPLDDKEIGIKNSMIKELQHLNPSDDELLRLENRLKRQNEDWKVVHDDFGRTQYYNKITGRIHFVAPEFKTPIEILKRPSYDVLYQWCGFSEQYVLNPATAPTYDDLLRVEDQLEIQDKKWKIIYDPDGRPYYVDMMTGEETLDTPPEFKTPIEILMDIKTKPRAPLSIHKRVGKGLLLLDFDKTLIRGHSYGSPYTNSKKGTFSIDIENLKMMNEHMTKWLKAGHKVVILTRCVDTELQKYFDYMFVQGYTTFETVLGMSDAPNTVMIVAPDKYTYNAHLSNAEVWWAIWKAGRAGELLNMYPGHGTLFVDDGHANVSVMKAAFPSIQSHHIYPGRYEETYATVDEILENPAFYGKRTCVSRSRPRRIPRSRPRRAPRSRPRRAPRSRPRRTPKHKKH
jgi:hypothetical protein